ncbi:CopD family protein [Pseudonocardia nantongensis]|uniref:CopD family protein n=1 Tax=Pseudonocardia nantongensis TaxID=1181885 RepID=UPI00397E1A8F
MSSPAAPSPTRRGQPSSGPVGGGAVLLGVAVLAAGATGGLGPGTVPLDLAATLTRAGADLAALTAAGAALAALLAPGRVPGADRVLIGAAAAWPALLLLDAVVRGALLAGREPAAVRVPDVVRYLTGPLAGTGLLIAGAAAVLLAGCALARPAAPGQGTGPPALGLGLAVTGLAAPAVTGHAAASAHAVVAVPGVLLHVVAAALWVGGLGAVLVLARDGAVLAGALPRFSRLAGWAVGALAASGVLAATARLGSPAELVTTGYGALLLAKIGLLGVAAALGGLTRRRLRAGRAAVQAWAAVEILVLAAAVGVAATLTRTA